MATQRELSRPEATSGAADLSAPGDLSSSAASFARYLRAANIAPATLKTYAEAVRTLILDALSTAELDQLGAMARRILERLEPGDARNAFPG